MAKTKPIGVRFDEGLLSVTKLSPQKALNLYEQSHRFILGKEANDKLGKMVIKDLTKPDVLSEVKEVPKSNYAINTKVKEGDPKEGTMAFFSKYGCMYYYEIKTN